MSTRAVHSIMRRDRPAGMSAPRSVRARRDRRRFGPVWLVGALLLIVVFLIGVALGEALHDNPRPGGTQTIVQTLKP